MKKIYLMFVVFFLTLNLNAQVEKAIENTAGKLDSLLTKEELNTITSLTLTGTMDARDFKIVRFYMPLLEQIDLSGVSVVAYTETLETGETTLFEANAIPEMSFYNKQYLMDVKLPLGITEIKNSAFQNCEALTTINIPSFVTRLGDAVFSECGRLTLVIIPPSVTSVGNRIFSGCGSLTSINIPSAVSFIGAYAFNDCIALTDITIPSAVSVIAPGTFAYCSSLTSINIPSSIDSIGEYAFFGCIKLTSILIPSSITEIGNFTFNSCSSLTSILLPSSVTSLGSNAFSYCSSLVSINIPPTVSFIGSEAFEHCSSLTSFSIPSAVTSIEAGVFMDCTNLTSVTVSPAIQSIGAKAFSGCNALTSITLPTSVTSIGLEAFLGCTALTSIILPPSVITIDESAFSQCDNLTLLSVPSSVEFIGSYAFGYCPKLTTVYSYKSVPVQNGSDYFYSLDKSKCTLHVPYGAAASYAAASEWKDFNLVEDTIGFSVNVSFIKFNQGAGQSQLNLRSTTAWHAISDQSWLKISPASGSNNELLTVSVEANNTTTNRYGIITVTGEKGESQRINITQKSNPEVIPVTADSLEYLLTKQEMDTIKSLILTGTIDEKDISIIVNKMPMLTQLDLSNTIITNANGIPTNWLPGPTVDSYRIPGSEVCGGILHKPLLTSLLLPATLEVIGCGGLSGCSGLTSITIPPTVKQIGEAAFSGCSRLISITIPSSVTYMGKSAFRGCSGLKEVRIDNGIEQIRQGTFGNCNSLTSITLPASLKSMEMYVFNESPNLASIYSYNSEPPYTEHNATFYSVNKATCTVYVPYGAAAAYAEAEEWKEFTHIVEDLPGFILSTSTVAIKAEQGSTSTATIASNVAWTASSDQAWLTVNPSMGSDARQLTFTADANTSTSGRLATVTFTAEGLTSKTITIVQETPSKTIHMAAGTLASVFTGEELQDITSLIITGEIDVRDFKTMRDRMPLLTTVDLRGATITSRTESEFYAANSIPFRAFYKKSKLTSLLLPVSVSVINEEAFSDCTGLTRFKIPSTVTVIGGNAFRNCINLDTIYSYPIVPPDLIDNVEIFNKVKKTTCTLYVPHGTKGNYAHSAEWKGFINCIEKLPVCSPSTNTVSIEADQGSMASVTITSDAPWKANSDQSWLTVNPTSGSMKQSLSFSTEANPSNFGRMAVVTVSAADYATQTITIIQEGLPKTIHLTAGALSNLLTPEELNGITNLTITGEMNIFDFQTIRDQMPLLTILNLSDVTIVPYSDPMQGKYGDANSVPTYAFFNPSTHMGKTSLTSILLPRSTLVIKYYSFSHCNGLTSIKIPSSVTSFESGIWNYCVNLDTIYAYIYPAELEEITSVFNHVKPTFIIYVPFGFKDYYHSATGWKDLSNIVEMPGISLSTSTVAVNADQGNTATATLTSNVNWTAQSDQSWLTIAPTTGSGDSELNFTAATNPSEFGRKATVTFSSSINEPQTITVIQDGKPKTFNLTAGSLSALLTSEELKGVTTLTITGEMDARDFKTMRDQMPLLTKVDLSEAHIKAYRGVDGTLNPYYDFNAIYNEDEIPIFAFLNSSTEKGGNNLTSILLPHTVKRIEDAAFSHCKSLKTITIPESVTYINAEAFNYCVNLDTLTSLATIPPELYYSREAFFNVNKAIAILYIPYGSMELYKQQDQWKDFKNTKEVPGISMPVSTVVVNAANESTSSVNVESNVTWTAHKNQSWLKIDPSTASGNQQLTFRVNANPTDYGRSATVTLSAPGVKSQIITVIQEGKPRTVNLTAGNLSTVLTTQELNGITSLTITGEMDGRDFKTMRDQMPLLSTIDLSKAKIVYYSESPRVGGEYNLQDVIPENAFYNPSTQKGKISLTTILLPGSIIGIHESAFAGCTGLTTLNIPSSVYYIQDNGFLNCIQLDTIYSFNRTPPQLASSSVFNNVKKTSSVLYVPRGTKELYSTAFYWREFKNIKETGGFELSTKELILDASSGNQTIKITAEEEWSTLCDIEWLSVSPVSGDSTETVTFTCQENNTSADRIATVTFSSTDGDSQSVTITQKGLVTATDEMNANAEIKYYPNPFTEQLSIDLSNPLHEELTIEIYSISGQKIKTLLRAQKGAKISCTWNGTNEHGQRVPNGIYLLKFNKITQKVILGK